MLQCPNGLRHVVLDVLAAPWKKIFLDFSRSGTQIEGKQNTLSTVTKCNFSFVFKGLRTREIETS